MSTKLYGMTPLEILKHLNRSNCRECGVPTCFAFATQLVNGEKKLTDCPHLSKEEAEELSKKIVLRGRDKKMEEMLGPLKKEISQIDFRTVAKDLGAEYSDDRLRIKCLGKDFIVDRSGNIESLIHVNSWVAGPLLKYVIMGGNEPLSGRWVSFEELKRASSVAQYFDRRCEEPMRQLAESHTDIFFDLINIFGGKDIEGFSTDYARVIYPLPKVPMLILYWRADGQFDSKLRLLLDSTADRYLDIEFIIALGRGIVEMFKKILSRHEELIPRLLAL
ncbi:MAG: hypothetical protein AMK71_09345 [Nitrospira bacterium SG8_35_4]|nr:MAG: hypothetical protein AMK71_09345 [Nitrospira bacterium SG8_35_4]